jgi:hypothetical protein
LSHAAKTTQNNFLRLLDFAGDTDMIFLNIHTLRLTKYGCVLFRKQFEYWEFDSPGTTANNMIALHRVMLYPYYIDKDSMILFTERDAFIARLGGPQNWLNGKKDEI